jgi:hypothetical protein
MRKTTQKTETQQFKDNTLKTRNEIIAIYEILKTTTAYRLNQFVMLKEEYCIVIYSTNESGEKRKTFGVAEAFILGKMLNRAVYTTTDSEGFVYCRIA